MNAIVTITIDIFINGDINFINFMGLYSLYVSKHSNLFSVDLWLWLKIEYS